MPIIQVTQADIAKLQNIPAGWYSGKVIKVNPLKNAKSGESINEVIEIELEHESGKVIPVTFNSQLIGRIVNLWEACMQQKFQPGTMNTDELLFKKCDCKVGQRTFEGQLIDEIQAFAPYGAGKNMTAPF
jgi:hypothetical protein